MFGFERSFAMWNPDPEMVHKAPTRVKCRANRYGGEFGSNRGGRFARKWRRANERASA
jgi:hypothetical protein